MIPLLGNSRIPHVVSSHRIQTVRNDGLYSGWKRLAVFELLQAHRAEVISIKDQLRFIKRLAA